jgi:hypothetical protein
MQVRAKGLGTTPNAVRGTPQMIQALHKKLKPCHLIGALFFIVLMTGTPIANRLGFIPAQDLIRTCRVRANKAGRAAKEALFI